MQKKDKDRQKARRCTHQWHTVQCQSNIWPWLRRFREGCWEVSLSAENWRRQSQKESSEQGHHPLPGSWGQSTVSVQGADRLSLCPVGRQEQVGAVSLIVWTVAPFCGHWSCWGLSSFSDCPVLWPLLPVLFFSVEYPQSSVPKN